MSIRIALSLFVALLAWWIWSATKPADHHSSPAKHEVVVEPAPAPTIQKSASPSRPRTQSAQANQRPTPSADEWDAFARRKLDKRKPRSLADLKAHITPYVKPMLDDGRGDGDVTSIYRGYYLGEEGRLNRIQFNRSPEPASLSFEGNDGREYEFHEDKMKVSNFDSDPYSLVIAVPGGVSVYLKFNTHKDMTGLEDKWFRAYEGWIFPSRKPVLMIDGYEPFRYPNEDSWPDPEVLKSELTKTLPEN